jgi:hypothetical protein
MCAGKRIEKITKIFDRIDVLSCVNRKKQELLLKYANPFPKSKPFFCRGRSLTKQPEESGRKEMTSGYKARG